MFPRAKRFPRALFGELSRGKRLHSRHFAAVIPRLGKGYAVVVSKKVAAKSVDRHLIKRRTLGALRSLALPPSLVVFVKAGASALSFAEIKAELATLLQ